MDIIQNIEEIESKLDSLIEKAEVWQKIFDESPLAIAVFTAEVKFYLVNKAFCELTNFEPEELYDQKISLVLPARLRRMHKQKEKEFVAHPQKKVNRHGLTPVICNKQREEILVDIDLSFFINDNKIYYTAFIKRL